MRWKNHWRWKQYSLRTLFILTALFAVWCNSQVQKVRERQLLQRHLESQGVSFTVAQNDPSISLVRRIIGDKAVVSVNGWSELSDADRTSIEKVFPEVVKPLQFFSFFVGTAR